MSKENCDESFGITPYIRTLHLGDSKSVVYGLVVLLSIVELFSVLSECAWNRCYPVSWKGCKCFLVCWMHVVGFWTVFWTLFGSYILFLSWFIWKGNSNYESCLFVYFVYVYWCEVWLFELWGFVHSLDGIIVISLPVECLMVISLCIGLSWWYGWWWIWWKCWYAVLGAYMMFILSFFWVMVCTIWSSCLGGCYAHIRDSLLKWTNVGCMQNFALFRLLSSVQVKWLCGNIVCIRVVCFAWVLSCCILVFVGVL